MAGLGEIPGPVVYSEALKRGNEDVKDKITSCGIWRLHMDSVA